MVQLMEFYASVIVNPKTGEVTRDYNGSKLPNIWIEYSLTRYSHMQVAFGQNGYKGSFVNKFDL